MTRARHVISIFSTPQTHHKFSDLALKLLCLHFRYQYFNSVIFYQARMKLMEWLNSDQAYGDSKMTKGKKKV